MHFALKHHLQQYPSKCITQKRVKMEWKEKGEKLENGKEIELIWEQYFCLFLYNRIFARNLFIIFIFIIHKQPLLDDSWLLFCVLLLLVRVFLIKALGIIQWMSKWECDSMLRFSVANRTKITIHYYHTHIHTILLGLNIAKHSDTIFVCCTLINCCSNINWSFLKE